MRMNSAWSRSDSIAAAAFILATVSLVTQCSDRDTPYRLQLYVDKTQAASKIIEAVEQLIHARQLAMVEIGWNVYEPAWAAQIPLERLTSDSKVATPVIVSLGNFAGTMQNNIRFWKQAQTVVALARLNQEASSAVQCFTDLASASHKLDGSQLNFFRQKIATSCAGQNETDSLDALKLAEAEATSTMDVERKKPSEQELPKLNYNPFS